MSLITRCPACATLFRVVPDQLKISDGWVRCGQCDEVFDAQAALQAGGADAPPTPAPGPAPAPTPAPAPEPTLAPEPEPEPSGVVPDLVAQEAGEPPHESPEEFEAPNLLPLAEVEPVVIEPAGEPDLQWTTPLEPTMATTSPAMPEPELESEPEQEPEPEPELEPELEPDVEPEFVPEPELEPEPEPEPSLTIGHPPEDEAPPQDDSSPQPQPALEQVSFVRQARRRAFWRRPLVRAGLVLVAVLLGLGLALQVAWQERDRLAQQVPALRPWLDRLCEPLACRIGPPRRIEAIVIDSSTFSRLRPDAYRLAVTLGNRSGTPVAMPALELTLTDTQDQPVLRRVLRPSELAEGAPASGPAIGANAEWSATLTIGVSADAGAGRIAGYRLLAFYP